MIPIAGDLITSDCAERRGHQDRKRLRQAAAGRPEAQVRVPGLGDRNPRMLSNQALAGVIEAAWRRIFSLVQR